MLARYYNPSTGTFLSQDPVFLSLPSDKLSILLFDPQKWNSYTYGRNNPLAYRDPDGNWSLQQIDLAVARFDRGQRFVGNILTLGAYSVGFDMIDSNVTQFSKNPSLGNGLAAIGSIPASVGLIGGGALATGATFGEVIGLKQQTNFGTSKPKPTMSGSANHNATGFLGHDGFELKNLNGTTRNVATEINGRAYSGHALDQMQNRGLMPSVVENTIRNGSSFNGATPTTTGFSDPVNNISVIINNVTQKVVTAIRGIK